jgi:flagellar basal-body rod modification protein FlgD
MPQLVSPITNPGFLLPAAQTTVAKAQATTTTSNAGSATTNLGSTFLNLLSTELKNQDPTAPVDSTAMVGQMISLNQLDQLIAMNQTLSGTSSSVTTATSANLRAAAAVTPNANTIQDTAQAIPQTALPFDPNTMMPLTPLNLNTTSISGGK